MQPLQHWLARQHRQRRLIRIIAVTALLSLCLVLLNRTLSRGPHRLTGRVIAVNDDLSLMLQTGEGDAPRRITLAGLRWPPAWRADARRQLEQQALHQQVRATRADYSPPAMLVYLDAGPLLNETLCDQGFAQCDAPNTGLIQPWLTRVERWAHRGKRGLWASLGDENPSPPNDPGDPRQ